MDVDRQRRFGEGFERLLDAEGRLVGVRDLFFAFGHFMAEFLVLSQQPLNFPMQLLRTRLVGVPMAVRRCLRGEPLSHSSTIRETTWRDLSGTIDWGT